MALPQHAHVQTVPRLNQVASQLSHAWFPVHPQVLQRIKSRFAEGIYAKNREQLVEDLKADCGLYLLCIRELSLIASRHSNTRSAKPVSWANFAALLYETPLEQFEWVLKVTLGKVSFHSLENMTRFQAERLEETVISASVVQELAETLSLDPRMTYNMALLRQLGLTLIAWNYPRVYRQALTMLREEYDESRETLDDLLQGLLGFSPAVLGVKIAQSWGLSESVTETLRLYSGEEADLRYAGGRLSQKASNEDKAAFIAQICAVGEALARANHPETYPNARQDWKKAERVIVECLGSDGVQKIYNRAQALSSDYAAFSPQLFRTVDPATPLSGKVDSEYARRKLQANLFLRTCPQDVKKKILDVYQQLKDTVDESLIRDFLFRVVPDLGYDSSCVFMLDPAAGSLMPLVKVGQPIFVKPKPVHLLEGIGTVHPVRAAFSKRAPVVEEGVHGGEQKTYVAGAIGEKRGIGVLYLELSPQAAYQTRKDHLTVFQSVRQCLHDLFHLE